jgi:hypothetical protein
VLGMMPLGSIMNVARTFWIPRNLPYSSRAGREPLLDDHCLFAHRTRVQGLILKRRSLLGGLVHIGRG